MRSYLCLFRLFKNPDFGNMKICLAQLHSYKGEIKRNIDNHLRLINQADKFQPDLIVFPELSITGYEPVLAEEVATDEKDSRFEVFFKAAREKQCSIAVGVPLRKEANICICLLFFHPDGSCDRYAKQYLHADELPYFTCGREQFYLSRGRDKAAFGICYESLRPEHFATAKAAGANIYIASVAKPEGGMKKGLVYYPKTAAAGAVPILLVNNVGFCDNFMSVGQSAVWDENGVCRGQLDEEREGILFYDTLTGELKQVNM